MPLPRAQDRARGLSALPAGPLVVAAALVDDLAAPTRLLAARRTAPASLAGGWELPGGKVEPGEGPSAALHRELVEELGVRVALGEEVLPPPALRRGGGWPLGPAGVLRVWWARVVDGVPTPLADHDELRWLPLDGDAGSRVEWLPADAPVVARLSCVVPGAS